MSIALRQPAFRTDLIERDIEAWTGWATKALRKARDTAAKFDALLKIEEEVSVKLSNADRDLALLRYLSRRSFGIPLTAGAAVLTLPDNPADYLRSRSRQALRTNRARANGMGLQVRRVLSDELEHLAKTTLRARQDIACLDQLLQEPVMPYMETWAGETARGHVIAFARFAVGTRCARIKYFAATKDRELSIIRWKMAADTFQTLGERGIRHVIAGPVLEPSDGLAYYQDRLGFRRCRINLVEAELEIADDRAQV